MVVEVWLKGANGTPLRTAQKSNELKATREVILHQIQDFLFLQLKALRWNLAFVVVTTELWYVTKISDFGHFHEIYPTQCRILSIQ